ncbi:MAG: RHS repeat-associated core domain-containing protein, partial [Actinomycetales bacterium]
MKAGLVGLIAPGKWSPSKGVEAPSSMVISADKLTAAFVYKDYLGSIIQVMQYPGIASVKGQVWTAAWRHSVNTLTGAYTRADTDGRIGGAGPQMAFTRQYSSADRHGGGFGPGWRHSFEYGLSTLGASVVVSSPDGREQMFTGSSGSTTYQAMPGNTSSLVKTATGWTLTELSGASVRFDAVGRAVQVATPGGHAAVLAYDASGHLVSVTNEVNGRSWTLGWAAGRITSLTGPELDGEPLRWTYTYTDGKLTAACTPAAAGQPGGCRTYAYDEVGLTHARDGAGRVVAQVGYAPTWRVASVQENGAGPVSFVYGFTDGDPMKGAFTRTTNGRGAVVRDDFDVQGRIIAQTDAAGYRTETSYGTKGWPESVTRPDGTRTDFTYTSAGLKLSETAGITDGSPGHTQWFSYDAANNLTNTRDARSSSSTDPSFLTQRVYDTRHNITSQTGPPVPGSPEGVRRTWTYSDGAEPAVGGGTVPAGLLVSLRDEVGRTTTYAYNAGGDLVRTTSPTGVVITAEYNDLGWVVRRVVTSHDYPDGLVTTMSYDARGQVVQTTAPATTDAVTGQAHQVQESVVFDASGAVASRTVRDVAGTDLDRVADVSWDSGGRMRSTTTRVGTEQAPLTTTYEYDKAGNLAAVVDPADRVTTFTYTPRDELATTLRVGVQAAGATGDVLMSAYTYDAAGRVHTETDVLGRTLRYEYDAVGRRTRTVLLDVVDPDTTHRDLVLEQVSYDQVGNVTSSTTGNGQITSTTSYDALNRVVSSEFDPVGPANPQGLARVVRYERDPAGRVTAQTTTDSTDTVQVRYGYGLGERPESSTVENGEVDITTWTRFNDRGLPVEVTDPRGSGPGDPAFTTTTTFDEAGRPVVVAGPPVQVEAVGLSRPTASTGYDAFGNPVHHQDASGAVTTARFDQLDRQVSMVLPAYTRPDTGQTLESVTSWSYDRVGRLAWQTTPDGVTEYTYDDLDHLIRRQDPAGASGPVVTSWSVDRAGRVNQSVDPTGAVVAVEYDTLDRAVASTQYVRAVAGAPATTATTRYSYDDRGFLVAEVTPTGSVSRYAYDAAGQVRTSTDAVGASWSFDYDVAGRVRSSGDPLGRQARTEFDQAGRPVAQEWADANGAVLARTSTEYDAAGNPISVRSARGFETTTRYDAAGRVVSVTDPIGEGVWRTQSLGYDAAGRVVRSTDGRGHGPDEAGTRASTDRFDTRYTYTVWGLLESVIEPVTSAHPGLGERTWTTSYDASARPAHDSQPGGVGVDRTFDAAGNLLGETGAGAGVVTASRAFTYDPAGRVTSVSHPGGVQTVEWDDRGLVVASAGPAGESHFEYDADARLVRAADPGGWYAVEYRPDARVGSFTYDPVGPTSPRADGATTITRDYDRAGQLLREGYQGPPGSGTTREFTWDGLGRLVGDTLGDPAGLEVARTGYEYDLDGNLVSQTSTGVMLAGQGGTTGYAYDRAGRLVETVQGDGAGVITGWDAADNRVRQGQDTFTFDERNRLLVGPAGTYTWSPRGTMTTWRGPGQGTGPGVGVDIDGLGRMVRVGSTGYAYDGWDRLARVDRDEGGQVFSYRGLDPDPVRVQASGVGDPVRMWRDVDGSLLGIADPVTGGVVGQGGDGAGPRLVAANQHTDAVTGFTTDGVVQGQATFDAFGSPAVRAGQVAGDLGFQSDLTDPDTGLVLMGARWYDPATGVFTSRDTMARRTGQAALMNRYGYALANPLGWVDPDGHCPGQGASGCQATPGADGVFSWLAPTYRDWHQQWVPAGADTGPEQEQALLAELGLSSSGHLGTVNALAGATAALAPVVEAVTSAGLGVGWAVGKASTAQGRGELAAWVGSGQARQDVSTWFSQNKDVVIGAGLVIGGAVISAGVPGGSLLGAGMIGAGADVLLQKVLTGEVNWAQAGLSGVAATIGVGNWSRLGASGTTIGAGVGAATGVGIYLAGDGDHTLGGVVAAAGLGALTGGLAGRAATRAGSATRAADEAPGVSGAGTGCGGGRCPTPGGTCFVAGTLVRTERGDVPIEQVRVGDKVWSRNTDTGTDELHPVIATYVRDSHTLVDLTIDGEVVTTTPDHPFMVHDRGWVTAGDLQPGDTLVTPTGTTTLTG